MKLTFGQGLNADALSNEMGEGFVNDCTNMRFRKGFAEVIGGTSATVATFVAAASGSPAWLGQLSLAVITYLVGIGSASGEAGAYAVGGASTPTDITRKTEGVTVSTATAAGTTVTITTASAHGRATGNIVSAWGFTPSTYNVESAAITVTGATTFTYVVPVAPAVTPATAMGMYSRDALASTFTAGTITGGELNGVLLVNTPNGCYYWNGDTALPLRKIVGSYTARVGIPFGNYVVQLVPTISGAEYLYRICWSNATEPGSVPHNGFASTATNQAGDVDKPEIGQLVFAEPLGDDLIVYGTKGRLVMRYVGGNDVFSFTVLPGEEGIYNTACVASIPSGHVFVDRDRHIRTHTGGVSSDISAGRVQSIIGTDDYTVYGAVAHPRQSEVWIYYKATTIPGTDAGLALIWNWDENTWGKATVPNAKFMIAVRTTFASSLQALYFIGNATGTLKECDSNANSALTASIERSGLDAGDTSVIKNLQRSRWNIDNFAAFTPVHTIQHGSSMFADTSPTYQSAVTYTPGTTDWANSRATGGRFMALKWSCTTSTGSTSTPFYGIRVRSADIDFTLGGKR